MAHNNLIKGLLMKRLVIIFSILFVMGCDNKELPPSNKSSTPSIPKSLKAPEQLSLQSQITSLNNQYMQARQQYGSGTREEESAYKSQQDFWNELKNQKIYAKNWTCRLDAKWDSQTGIWDANFPNPYYRLPYMMCYDSDIPKIDISQKMKSYNLAFRLYTSKAPNLPSFYAGDVIYISGPVREISSSSMNQTYQADIDAEYVGLQPQP